MHDLAVRGAVALLVGVAAVLGATIARAGDDQVGAGERRSGTILAIDREDREAVAVVLRVGPWRIRDEDAVPGNTPLRIAVRPSTEVRVLNRAAGAASPPRPEDIIASSVTPEVLEVGEYATVTFRRDGTELVADRIDLIPDPLGWNPNRPSAPGGLVVRPK